MDPDLLRLLLLIGLDPAPWALHGDLLLGGLFFLATAALIALCIPGVLVPMALGSGALIGAWEASIAVALGAASGSLLFFLVARYFAAEKVRAKLGSRFEALQRKFEAHGLWYVIGLRVVGAPHFLVTAASALMPIRPSSFAAATFVGFLPAIVIAALAGSAI
jgi:uncharacterized membrane protein YdjX (TVP38/TMEM64 family)